MLKNLKLLSESRGNVACLLAILLATAILFVVVLPLPADFDHVTFALPVLVFCLVVPLQVKSDRVPLQNSFSPSEPFLAASFGRAPPADK
jgi:hypothetical protein